MDSPTASRHKAGEILNMQIILPDGSIQSFDINKRRTVDEVKQIVLTRNYKIRGTRTDYFFVLNDSHVLVPEYRKFFEAHSSLAAALKAGTPPEGHIRLVHRRDVEISADKLYSYRPKEDAEQQQPISLSRRSVYFEDDSERKRIEAEQESRRQRRMSTMRREEEAINLELEMAEQAKRAELGKRTEDDVRKRREERARSEEERKKRLEAEEAAWEKQREERRQARDEERKRLEEERRARQRKEGLLDVSSRLSSTGDRSSIRGNSSREELESLQDELARATRELQVKNEETAELKALLQKNDSELEHSRKFADTLQVRLERTERDVERARQLAETRMTAADREIALLKAAITRFRAIRDCVRGEIQRCNEAVDESANRIESRVILDRVSTRLDQADTGTHWRSTRDDYTKCLFSPEDLRDYMMKYPVRTEGSDAPAPANDSSDAPAPTSPAPAPAPEASVPLSPLSESVAQPEVQKICNLGPDLEIDYWSILPDLGDLLGEGGYAEVFRCMYKDNPVAVKKFKVNYDAMEDGESPMDTVVIRREILILSKLDHPNVMKFYGASVIMPNICLVTELLANGNLDQRLEDKAEVITWDQRLRWAIDTAEGLHYLHTFKPPVIHRDIKSANVLLDDNMNAKLSDFGLAKMKYRAFDMPTSKDSSIPPNFAVVLNSSPVGTAAWCSPEILEHAPYNELADIYSFGVLLWELVTRERPYPEMENAQIIELTLDKKSLEIPESSPPLLTALMKACWQYDPWARPTAEQLVVKLKEAREAMKVTHPS